MDGSWLSPLSQLVSTPVNPQSTTADTWLVVSFTESLIFAFLVSAIPNENENVVEALVGADMADNAGP